MRPGRLPTLRHVPRYHSSAGPEAVELTRACGQDLDDWQQDSLYDALGERADGRWSAFRVVVEVSRQNGKGGILEARVLAGLQFFDERLIMWTAHEMKTSMEAFRRVEGLIDASPDLRKLVAPRGITRANGKEAIEFRNGARLKFVARSSGSGRGFSGDCVILDEAYALTDDHMSALMPTMSARRNPQLWFTSSPPLDGASGAVMFRLRDAALAALARVKRGGPPERGLAYLGWGLHTVSGVHEMACLDLDCAGCKVVDLDNFDEVDKGNAAHAATGRPYVDLGDPALWERHNPAYGQRISADFTAEELSTMDRRAFARERIGVWPRQQLGSSPIDRAQWASLLDADSQMGDGMALVIDVTPDRSSTALVMYGRRDDELGHVEVIDQRRGTDWVVARVVELREMWRPVAVALDPSGPAGSLVDDLDKAGVRVSEDADDPVAGDLWLPNGPEMSAAVGQFIDAVNQGTLRHIGQPQLTTAVENAATRTAADTIRWARRSSAVDISPLVAATVARAAWEKRAHLVADADYDLLDSFY